MTALLKTEGWYTPEEYLERERLAETKSEYLNGYIVERTDPNHAHNVISRNIGGLLFNRLTKTCMSFGSDMKVRIEKMNCFRYPDISALCGQIDFYDEVTDAFCNPSLIAEVLSPSTERIDRGEKFAEYRLIDSFIEYLLVSSDNMEVERHRKEESGRWTAETFTKPEEKIELESIRVELELSEIYQGLDFTRSD